MGFIDRLSNLWRGFTSLWLRDVEARNPEVVYEAALKKRVETHKQLKVAVADIVYQRNKLSDELKEKRRDLADVQAQIPVAVESGDDVAALHLIERKDQLESSIATLEQDLVNIESQAEEAKRGLAQFAGEIEKLKRERAEMLAQKKNAEARIRIQEQLSGLSLDADIQALDNVRESIHKLKAQAEVGSELQGDDLQSRLKKIREKTASHAAQAQLDELKKQMASRKQAAEQAPGVKKTM